METEVNPNRPLIIGGLIGPANLMSAKWQPFRAGIEISPIYSNPGGPISALLRYAPGACLDRHMHTGYEHILVLSGSQIDDAGIHETGTLLIHPPGTSHAITSPNGCIVLAIWEKGVQFEGATL